MKTSPKNLKNKLMEDYPTMQELNTTQTEMTDSENGNNLLLFIK
jgi:hypothetical protein